MYIGVIHFDRPRDKVGRIASDARPMASARRFTLDDKTIVIRAREKDDGFALRVTRNALGGEVLYEGIVPDGQYTGINDDHASFWVISLSSAKFDMDASNKGVWTGERGSVDGEDTDTEYEGEPEPNLRELLAPTERELPSKREATEIRGDDIRYLSCSEGSFFDGYSRVEAWYVPDEGCYHTRFWHTHSDPASGPLTREQASRIHVPERMSCNDMEHLIDTLMGLGLASTYSYYANHCVCDGGGWGLSIGTRDGYAWQWDGLNAYPHGWDEARAAICHLLLGYPANTQSEGHTSPAAEWHEEDGDEGRTKIAHLYRHGYALAMGAEDEEWTRDVCTAVRQDLLLYRRTRRTALDYVVLDGEHFAEVMADVHNGDAWRRTAGELVGALGYVIDHDDTGQTTLRGLAHDGALGRLLCNEPIRAKAAPGLEVTGWNV
jgi:hypothetical protein